MKSNTLHLLPVAYGAGANRKGCEHASDALLALGLRAACQRNGHHSELAPTLHTPPGERWAALATLLQQQTAQVTQSIEDGMLPVVIGGDHTIAAATWRGVGSALNVAPGLIWIDAHLDGHTPLTSHSGNPHGMSLAALLGHGANEMTQLAGPALDPTRVVVIGLRSWEQEEHDLFRLLGVHMYDMQTIAKHGLHTVLRYAIEIARGPSGEAGHFGVSLDLDVIDPIEAPAVGTPAAQGLHSNVLITALRGIAYEPGFCALELVEYNPLLDVEKHSAHIAIDLVSAMFDQNATACIYVENTHGAHNYAPLPVVLTQGKGSILWDVEGKRYLDFMSAYSSVNFGHAHPRLLAALSAQAGRLAVTSRAFHNDRLPLLLERLTSLTGMDKALPLNTGLEAVETALKAARKWGEKVKKISAGKTEIIACEGNFHGRSIAIVGLSTEPQYRDGFGPFPAGTLTIPYGDAEALEAAINRHTAAFIVEAIQCEGGIRIPPAGYLAVCAEICKRHNVLLIVDEVQTGLGRTGKLLACQHEGVKPDGLCLGKALGGGLLPVSAFLARRDVMDVFTPGDHGSTFGGNALSAAVALEALAILEDEHLVERAEQLGKYMIERIKALHLPAVLEVRGKGMLIGIEVDPAILDARAVCEALMQRGLLTKETHHTVIRLAPPLTIADAELELGIKLIAEVITHLGQVARAA
ncbi:MAG TPA: ornithine--oxo-acid transaminase [Rhodocyclaceae bacterium]|nr:ornithine--oxo-acid transaminase [Rhodocyclaceae bacterium]